VAKRLDGWTSLLTRMGTSLDKFSSVHFAADKLLVPEELSELYYNNPLAAKICNIFAEESLREGLCVKDAEGAEIDALKPRLVQLDAIKCLTDGAVFGAVYGRAGVYLGVTDSISPSAPLDPTKVKHVDFLRVVDRRDLVIQSWYTDPLSQNYNLPCTFTFAAVGANGSAASPPVHESRFLWFRGARTGQREAKLKNQGYEFSKLQRIQQTLLRVGVSWEAAAQLLQTVSQTVMKVQGLQEAATSAGGAKALENRAMLVDLARSITKSLWIDADGEDVMQLSTNLTGVSDILDRLGAMLAAATDLPVTKLFGVQPTGLGATGAADERTWNNRVESYRLQEIKPCVDLLVACLAAELSLRGEFHVTFPSLDRPTDAETAAIRLQIAQADALYVSNQIVLPEEIAVSRFGGAEYSIETNLNDGPRDDLFPEPEPEPTKPVVASK
jgi:phage-related protein (TIGR01555 family)